MNKKNYKFAAIDIGGTNIRFAIIKNNTIVTKVKFHTDQIDWKKNLDQLLVLIKEHNINAIGLCIPGPADYDKGIILNAPNLKGWNGNNIKQYLQENANLDYILFANDANVMAYANHIHFKQTEKDVTQFFTISTGLGAGLVINNQMYTGSCGYAQEIAYIPTALAVDQKYHLSPYALELYSSGTGISLRAKNLGLNLEAKDVFRLYNENEIATKVINEGIESLARLIAISIGMLNPNLIVFGGTVTHLNKWYVEKAIALAKDFTEKNQYAHVQFKFDNNGDDSALFGLHYLIQNFVNNQ